jgi:hypothetical protein
MKIRLLILGFIIPILGFSQTDKKDFIFDWHNNKSAEWILIDSTYEKFTPTIEEIEIAKQLAKHHIDSLEQNRDKKYGKLLDFKDSDYYRQYIGYIDDKGNRIIFINAVCGSYAQKRNLNNVWIFVFDGGSCFYQIKVNLKSDKCFDFSVNGVA